MSGGGLQVASVKRSTSLRMKNLGKVPPRLETLPVVSATCHGIWNFRNLRCEQGHVGPPNGWIRDPSMEGRNCNEHDRAHECGVDVLSNHHQHVPRWHWIGRIDHDGDLGKDCRSKPCNECPAPEPQRCILC